MSYVVLLLGVEGEFHDGMISGKRLACFLEEGDKASCVVLISVLEEGVRDALKREDEGENDKLEITSN